jgi:hypothetical protein
MITQILNELKTFTMLGNDINQIKESLRSLPGNQYHQCITQLSQKTSIDYDTVAEILYVIKLDPNEDTFDEDTFNKFVDRYKCIYDGVEGVSLSSEPTEEACSVIIAAHALGYRNLIIDDDFMLLKSPVEDSKPVQTGYIGCAEYAEYAE